MNIIFYANKNLIKFNHSIRHRQDILNIFLNVINLNLLQETKTREDITICFCTGKTSRILIYETEDKIHSFHFPLYIKQENGRYVLSANTSIFPYEINACVLSVLKSILFGKNIFTTSFEVFFDCFMETVAEYGIASNEIRYYWNLLIYLFTFESGYLRLDYDTKSASQFHPESHIDFYYSQNITFKTGLYEKWDLNKFTALLDKEIKNIFYLQQHNP